MRSAFIACALWGIAFVARAEVHPIVDAEDGLLVGASNGKKWLAGPAAKNAVKSGAQYHIYSLTENLGATSGGKPEEGQDVCAGEYIVALKPRPKNGSVALAGDWNAMPRVPRIEGTTQKVYVNAVHDFLAGHGLRDPKVKITQVLRIDLDGDGEDEVLISGTNFFTKDGSLPSEAPAGGYSFVLVRRVVSGKVETRMLAGDFFPKAGSQGLPMSYRVSAILDLSGDGTMEVIVRGAYYEGFSDTVFRCGVKKIETLLQVACGA